MHILDDIPQTLKRGWELLLNGVVVTDVTSLTLSHPKFGFLEYGLSPTGNYDVWTFHETGGGGSVLVPFSCIDREIYVGLVYQDRFNQGGVVWNLPRGFISSGETHLAAAKRELVEETGISADKFRFPVTVLGKPTNPNSAFFNTMGEGEGVKFYAVEIPSEFLERRDNQDVFVFGQVVANAAAKEAEHIVKCEFVPWRAAIDVTDMFTIAGIGRLVARYLNGKHSREGERTQITC